MLETAVWRVTVDLVDSGNLVAEIWTLITEFIEITATCRRGRDGKTFFLVVFTFVPVDFVDSGNLVAEVRVLVTELIEIAATCRRRRNGKPFIIIGHAEVRLMRPELGLFVVRRSNSETRPGGRIVQQRKSVYHRPFVFLLQDISGAAHQVTSQSCTLEKTGLTSYLGLASSDA
ncbi:MAG: hypothetical protein UY96_C0003G0108 [Parcubacteria group bacterium GW2011_GWB1_56_8]|nr:MAG: hypothetical protein UY96_C0003G0108 [Parcubacteria group bacterium GW2011_GWB1_56_8]